MTRQVPDEREIVISCREIEVTDTDKDNHEDMEYDSEDDQANRGKMKSAEKWPFVSDDNYDEEVAGLRFYLRATSCEIFRDLLKHAPHFSEGLGGFIANVKEVGIPSYVCLIVYLRSMELFGDLEYQERRRGMRELGKFVLQVVQGVIWDIGRHLFHGGSDPLILAILETSKRQVNTPRPAGPPQLDPLQRWAVGNRHRSRLLLFARGADTDEGELRTKTGLPQLGAARPDLHFFHQYYEKHGELPYDLLPLANPKAEKILGEKRIAAREKRKRLVEGRKRLKMQRQANKDKVKALESWRRVLKKSKAAFIRFVQFQSIMKQTGAPQQNIHKFDTVETWVALRRLLKGSCLVTLRKMRRLLKKLIRETIAFLHEARCFELKLKRQGQEQAFIEGAGRILCDYKEYDSDKEDDKVDDEGDNNDKADQDITDYTREINDEFQKREQEQAVNEGEGRMMCDYEDYDSDEEDDDEEDDNEEVHQDTSEYSEEIKNEVPKQGYEQADGDGERRLMCDYEDYDADDEEYHDDVVYENPTECTGERKNQVAEAIETQNEKGKHDEKTYSDDADNDDDWDDDDDDTACAVHVEHFNEKICKTVTGEKTIQSKLEDMKKGNEEGETGKEYAADRLVEAREKLIRGPNFAKLSKAKQRWLF